MTEPRTTDIIENERVSKLKEIIAAKENLNTVCIEKRNLEKQLEDLTEAIRQARHVIGVKRTEVEILESEFWRTKNG